MRCSVWPDERVVDGDSDPCRGGEPVAHVERLAQGYHQGEAEAWSCQQGRLAGPRRWLERVEGVAVTIQGAGAAAEHPSQQSEISLGFELTPSTAESHIL